MKMFAHIKNLPHLSKLQDLRSFSPELACLQIFMEDTKAQHSSVTKQRHFQSVQSRTKLMKTENKASGIQIFISEVPGNLGVQCIASATVDIGTQSVSCNPIQPE
jgi:hypothetical protein